jgi:hypothetical protein
MSVFGELSLEEAMDLSQDRLLPELQIFIYALLHFLKFLEIIVP